MESEAGMTWLPPIAGERHLREMVSGRLVALVAPGASLQAYPQAERDFKIDQADIIVRANGPWPITPRFQPRFGTRTDIWYVGGKRKLLRRAGGELARVTADLGLLCIYPIRRRPLPVRELSIEAACPVRWTLPSKRKYRIALKRRGIDAPPNNRVPTTGMVAILELLACKPRELHLIGFTFWRFLAGWDYLYAGGYHGRKRMRRSSIHGRADQGERRPHSLETELRLARALAAEGLVIPDPPLRQIMDTADV
jgi:hypothetical protein